MITCATICCGWGARYPGAERPNTRKPVLPMTPVANPTAAPSGFRLRQPWHSAVLFAAVLFGLTACGNTSADQQAQSDEALERTDNEPPDDAIGLFGEGGLFGAFTLDKDDEAPRGGIGVNAFLWRASLDTLSFLPLVSADPFGGVIITDWYRPPESPGERFKLTVLILDTRLRADALRVSAFRQVLDESGQWADSALDAETIRKLEDTILTRAREMRIAALQQ